MSTILTLQRIWADRDNGWLRDTCHSGGIDLLVILADSLHGGQAEEIDIAYSAVDRATWGDIRRVLCDRYGARVRVHDLDPMQPRRRRQMLAGAALLVGQARGKFAEMLADTGR